MAKKFLKATSCYLNDLTGGKSYEVFAKFKTKECASGTCIIIFDDAGTFSGFDLEHFE